MNETVHTKNIKALGNTSDKLNQSKLGKNVLFFLKLSRSLTLFHPRVNNRHGIIQIKSTTDPRDPETSFLLFVPTLIS